MADKSAVGLEDLRRAARFPLEGVTSDMRRAHIYLVKQLNVEIRLRLPDVQHHAEVLSFVQACQQRGVIDDRTTAGINQNSASLQTTDQRLVSKMQLLIRPLFKQRRVKRQHVTLFNQLIQRAEIPVIAVVFTRRIAQQRADP